jgi:hypothetical protein
MKIKLIEDSLPWPACAPLLTGFALHDRRGDAREMPCYLPLDETIRTGEQVRLRRSWEAVLVETGPSDLEAGRW